MAAAVLDAEQLDELEYRVAGLLEEPWDKAEGRPRELTLREALVVTCGYLRQNIIEDVWAEIFGVAQSTISRYITFLTPFVEKAAEPVAIQPELSMVRMGAGVRGELREPGSACRFGNCWPAVVECGLC